MQQATVRASWAGLFEEPTLLSVGHRLKACVCAELVVDVVEMVAERLSGNAQLTGNRRGVAAVGEEFRMRLRSQDARLSTRYERFIVGPGAPP